MSKSKASAEAQQLLDDLDSIAPAPVSSKSTGKGTSAVGKAPGGGKAEGEAEALAFIDEMTQKSNEPTKLTPDRPLSRSGTPTLRKTTERVKLGGGGSTSSLLSSGSSPKGESASSKAKAAVAAAQAATESPVTPEGEQPSSSGWGWGSVWSGASAAIQQARTVVDEQVKNLPKNEQARKWGEGMLEYAKAAQLDKMSEDFKRVGFSTLTDILNVVAPPISEHEVIHVWLTHDMKGYDGIESLVYRAMARILEQVEGGDLVVNRGEESRPKSPNDSGKRSRELNTVDDYDTAVKLAQANLLELIKSNAKATQPKQSSTQSPTTYSHVYLRVQPYFTTHSVPAIAATPEKDPGKEAQSQQNLQFLLYFSDPVHELTHITVTQSVPGSWLAIWDDYDWVEDLVAESLRLGVEVIGQEYIVARMGWAKAGMASQPESEGHQKELSDVEKDAVIVNEKEDS